MMKIGIGLPNTVAGAPATLIPEWARAAEAGPFASLGVHDRLLYDSVEPLAALSAVSSVTERVELACLVAIAPLRPPALLAKQARSVDALSGGRLALGLGIGPREDDYALAGVSFAERGRIFENQLAELRRLWRHPGFGPLLDRQRPKVLLGGASDVALLRLTRYADGYVHNGGPARAFRTAADRVLSAWSDSGRPGRPELWGLGYFALGPDAEGEGRQDLLNYYGFTGGFVSRIAGGMLASSEAVRQFITSYREVGCDHLVLFPTVARIEQVERLAEAVELV
jgi:alkanesulfonate monooxygenase SsuD/methylene tetrahydromethanopterin reductase-like flavin-dependent oxidoreductase (luciferase family)